ncbi:3651_t:CDS:2 [Funneliformis caledonium]|uniref:3651_t:CDS:1 n=1 Tax=Funneliformis caledonium TaxID=1117310 RepID=A0A9N9BA56_9GLOM|nr:3651_t:CDS:2 [Funneliformis caledonium]
MSLHILPDVNLPPSLEESENKSNSIFGKCLECGKERIRSWIDAIDSPDPSKLSEQFELSEENIISSFHTEMIHPEAFYTSRILYFSELYKLYNDQLL